MCVLNNACSLPAELMKINWTCRMNQGNKLLNYTLSLLVTKEAIHHMFVNAATAAEAEEVRRRLMEVDWNRNLSAVTQSKSSGGVILEDLMVRFISVKSGGRDTHRDDSSEQRTAMMGINSSKHRAHGGFWKHQLWSVWSLDFLFQNSHRWK